MLKKWIPDSKGLCSSGKLDSVAFKSSFGMVNAEVGLMSGVLKKDKLAYKIALPTDSTKTWSKGVNSHFSIGTGIEQGITVNAKIVPASSTSLYLAQDSYLDNITVEVNY